MRKPNIHGGGSKTNLNGLTFEGRTDFIESLKNNKDFKVDTENSFLSEIIYKGQSFGFYTEKHDFYKFLNSKSVDWEKLVSKKYLPDGVFINTVNNKIYIIEKKFQSGGGSVDEKLQTCDFKKKIYEQLTAELNEFKSVEYYYLLNSWFKQKQYDDVKEYIDSVGCKYFIEQIDLKDLGIV
jgi:hypothetical protein